MQLASTGARVSTRNASSFLSTTSRSIHIPAYARPHISSTGTAQRIVARTRTFLGQFVAHLTASGLTTSTGAPSYAKAIHGGTPGRMTSIQQRLSLPVRTSLSRPLQGHYFPRAPAVGPPCSVTNAGLGSARNFSSGRSVFQNLAENVPIAGRAFYEADWDVKGTKQRGAMKKDMKSHQKVGKEMLKPKCNDFLGPVAERTTSEEIEHYFSTSPSSGVTTCLLIPLAPTPTSRVPLPEYAPERQSFLPHTELWDMHNDHELHSLRVSSLFSRLDVANVWERGVQCSAYAHGAGVDGVCTILKVEFIGWTKSQVRGVIGESGTGWCVLEETTTQPSQEDDDAHSDTSSMFSGISGDLSDSMEMPSIPASEDSFILPTLDFSSSFRDSAGSSLVERPDSAFDMFSDSSSDSWSDLSDPPESLYAASSVRFGFSSDFLNRSELEVELSPREVMF